MAIASVNIKIVDHSDEVMKAIEEKMPTLLKSVGEECEGYAKKDCPVNTGLLRNSITYGLAGEPTAIGSYKSNDGKKSGAYGGTVPKEDNPKVFSVSIGTNVAYAPSVEFKDTTHKTGKAHFLRDAMQNHAEHYKEIIEAGIASID